MGFSIGSDAVAYPKSGAMRKLKTGFDWFGSDFQSGSWSWWKFFPQGLLKIFQSKSAEKYSGKVWLKKGKHMCTIN